MEKKAKKINNPAKEIIESLSINERKILPFLSEKTVIEISNKSGLEEVAVLRALEYLGNKKIIELKIIPKKIVELGLNGVLYKQKGLPERRLLTLIAEKSPVSLANAPKLSQLTPNEFQAALGALKKKALVNLVNGNIIFSGTKSEISRKTLEEQFLEVLPAELEKLEAEQKFALEQLKNRKNIIEINSKNDVEIKITELGKEIAKDAVKISAEGKDLVEAITSEMIINGSWKGKKFRRYDVASPVPKISAGKRHFVNQSIDYARKVWAELGFKEMPFSNLTQTGFWNFDALFTAQDHPVREIHDTFYIKDVQGKLPADKKIIQGVKEAHEKGVAGAKGWGYEWKEDEAKRVILRTHTTVLSGQTLAMLGKLKTLKDKQGKFGQILDSGKCQAIWRKQASGTLMLYSLLRIILSGKYTIPFI